MSGCCFRSKELSAEVQAKYHLTPATERKLSPFGVEVTGAFGASARKLCAAIVDATPGLDDVDEDGDAVAVPAAADVDARRVRSVRLWQLKARIVAAVFRGNAVILAKYSARELGEPA